MSEPAKPSVRKIIKSAVQKPVQHVDAVVDSTAELLHSSGHMQPGDGIISSVIALSLGFLSLLAVAAFHFPQYLTTPELRHEYSVDVLRQAGRLMAHEGPIQADMLMVIEPADILASRVFLASAEQAGHAAA